MRLLEAVGYECFRTAGSHSPFDVIAISKQGIILAQVKTNGWPSPADMETMRDFPAPDNVTKLAYRWNKGVRLPLVKEAL
jgi:hypothetical protein